MSAGVREILNNGAVVMLMRGHKDDVLVVVVVVRWGIVVLLTHPLASCFRRRRVRTPLKELMLTASTSEMIEPSISFTDWPSG